MDERKFIVPLQQISYSNKNIKAKFMEKKKFFKLSKTLGGRVLMGIMACVCMSVLSTSCSEEGKDEAPGLWTALDAIQTFPGDTVLVQGQVSNYIGLSRVDIKCAAWDISQTYNLQGKQSKVFNYNYQMAVPQTATFTQGMVLKVTATDTDGQSSVREIPITFLPDTTEPWCENAMPATVGVFFNDVEQKGIYELSLTMCDDRCLKDVTVSIPTISYSKTTELNAITASITDEIVFPAEDTYTMTVCVTDTTGNQKVYSQDLLVMKEEEDPIADYPYMWLINADENESNYLDGYYAPLTRDGEYQYKCNFYADKDGFKFYLTKDKTQDTNVFGVSPYVSSKLMNRAGYVEPITIEKAGYYWLWIDLQAHSYAYGELDTSAAYTGSLRFAGQGYADWGAGTWGYMTEDMTRNGYRYTYTVKQNGDQSWHDYYAYNDDTWSYILRYWSGASGCGWWEDTGSYGGSVAGYDSTYDGDVEVTFDTAILWATIKKK